MLRSRDEHRTLSGIGGEVGGITAVRWLLAVAFVLAHHLVLAAPQSRAQNLGTAINPTAAFLLDFHQRVEKYMELREDAAQQVPGADVTSDPAQIRARENGLVTRIRAL